MPNKSSVAMIVIGILLIGVIFIVFGLVLVVGYIGSAASALCAPTGGTSVEADLNNITDEQHIAGYNQEQLTNAAHIIKAGEDLGLNVRDQTIGVMTAMGESSLKVIDYGDGPGPDSRGLFQQRANGAWGSYADRMDPYTSATNFFRALEKIDNRAGLAPTIAAHKVQINADPYHYEKYWPQAVEVVEALSGKTTGLETQTTSTGQCAQEPTTTAEVNPQGWSRPADGPVTGGYGPREVIMTPSGPTEPFHYGTDFNAGGCGGPIWAAHDGTVTQVAQDSGGGWYIEIDHGKGVATWYVHMYSHGILVDIGDTVKSGQQIARTGSSGYSTACHLHFEVHINGEKTDSTAFLHRVGIAY